ncbi:importin subunit alpha-8-like isoform X2 [Mizuhopecten yessoensis]|uniref:Importin subunit alpha n=1 Tax=Mizuhopecten yessoensis TaxID=6573 RepID=A0A210PWU4_MIZYE|nr:importin subunit alpha-8-like isoform X2 [Mizuhopecten yessoensis]OWF40977.1 Importin subunit alpha-B [Mizuhopecten yessoensis]
MDRKSQYKHKADDVQKIRDRTRNEDVALRKEKKEKALNAKRFRFITEEEAGAEVTQDEVRNATAGLQKPGPHRLENLKSLKHAFSQGTVYIDAFFSIDNSLRWLVSLFTGQDVELQQEAAWCITNISAGTHQHAVAIAKYVAPYLVTYLSSSVPVIQDQSAWALGNLAGDSKESCTMIQAQGVVLPLVQLLQSPHPSVVQSASFALSNMAKESQDIAREIVLAKALPLLQSLLVNTPENQGILTEVSWVLSYLAASGEFSEEMAGLGMLTQIVDILVQLVSTNPHIAQIVTPLLRCLGNMCSGPDEYTQMACVNPALLQTLAAYLASSHRHIRKETLWVLSNMAGEPHTCHTMIFGPLLPVVLDQVAGAYDIKMEALYVLCNIACHGEEFSLQLLTNGILQKLAPVLKAHDVEILNLGLALTELILRNTDEGKKVLEECGGLDGLEALEYHNNLQLRERACNLLETYFYLES